MYEYLDINEYTYIDTGVRPDSIKIIDTTIDRPLIKYECIPYRHFKAEIVEDINEETCKVVREKLFAQGHTDILFLDDDFIRDAIGTALLRRKDGEIK